MIPYSDKPLMITCDYRSGTGYATLTREIIKILYKNNIDFRLLPEPELFQRCTSAEEDIFFDSFIIKPHERQWLSNDDYIYFRLYPPRENPKRKFNIGFTMVEGYTVNPKHVKIIDDSFDLVLVPSFFVQNVLSQYMSPDKLEVIPLGVDTNLFKKKEPYNVFLPKIKKVTKKGFVNCDISEVIGKFKFTMNGSFNHRKGVDLGITAYKRTFSSLDDVALILFCTPENPFEAHRMENRLYEILNDSVDSLPTVYVCDDSYPTYMQAIPYTWSDCFVFPSRGEGFGLPVLEAGACGVPVISSNHTGLSDFVNNSNAFVIDIDIIDDIGDIEKQYDINTYSGRHPEWTKDMFHHQTKNCYFPIMYSPRVYDQICNYMEFVFKNKNSNMVKEKISNMSKMIEDNYTWNNSASYLMNIFKTLKKRD